MGTVLGINGVMNDTNPVQEAVQPISTDQRVGGSNKQFKEKGLTCLDLFSLTLGDKQVA